MMEKARQKLCPGVAAGLAWTEAGGDVLYVEAVPVPESRGLMITGQLGDVMRESAKAARSYIHSRAKQLGFDANEMARTGVHIPFPKRFECWVKSLTEFRAFRRGGQSR